MLHRNQSKRLDKLEAKTRAQFEEMKDRYWRDLLAGFAWQERHAAETVLWKWFNSPLEHKADDDALQQHFTPEEVGLLKRVDEVWATSRFETMRECMAALWVALQACERVKA